MKKYPLSLQVFYEKLRKINIPARVVFFVMGILSTLWFLIRVIPKPQRATYPCIRATFPFMSGLVVYLLSLGTSFFAFRKFRKKIFRLQPLLAVFFLLLSLTASVYFLFSSSKKSYAAVTGPSDPPNTPIGTAQGIMPGRVVWAWNPDATNENCTDSGRTNGALYDPDLDDYYFNVKNNNQAVIDSMMAESIKTLTGKATEEEAWNAIFTYFNQKKKGSATGYGNGEIVFIKINAGSQWKNQWSGKIDANLNRRMTQPDIVETTPFSVMALLKSLINKGGVPQDKIYIGDPMKNVYQDIYEYWKAEFPNINVLGNDLIITVNDLITLGRVKVAAGNSKVIYSDGTQEDFLYDVFDYADYIINVAALKGHYCAGITLCAKNHFGSQTRNNAGHLHYSLIAPDNNVNPPNESNITNGGYGKYRVFVDIMGHPKLGGNTMLFIVDGLYSGMDGYFAPSRRWRMYPFNNDYPSSLFMSLDQVALESVCFDFLRTEYDGTDDTYGCPNYPGVDDYLHQAADKANWPAGISYKPDGVNEIGSLGVHEHWNNHLEKKYSRNLDPVNGKGIELVGVAKAVKALSEVPVKENTDGIESLFPNPCQGTFSVRYTLAEPAQVSIEIYTLAGVRVEQLVNQHQPQGTHTVTATIREPAGIYLCRMKINRGAHTAESTGKIQIIK